MLENSNLIQGKDTTERIVGLEVIDNELIIFKELEDLKLQIILFKDHLAMKVFLLYCLFNLFKFLLFNFSSNSNIVFFKFKISKVVYRL